MDLVFEVVEIMAVSREAFEINADDAEINRDDLIRMIDVESR